MRVNQLIINISGEPLQFFHKYNMALTTTTSEAREASSTATRESRASCFCTHTAVLTGTASTGAESCSVTESQYSHIVCLIINNMLYMLEKHYCFYLNEVNQCAN